MLEVQETKFFSVIVGMISVVLKYNILNKKFFDLFFISESEERIFNNI